MIKRKKYPFDLIDIDKLDCQWNWVVSQRSTGKTYQPLLKGLEDFFNSGEKDQIAIVRRWDSDWTGGTGMRTCYNSLICNGDGENMILKLSKGKYDGVDYRAGIFTLTSHDDEGEQVYHRDKIIAYGFSLNMSERIKGGSFPNIHRILIDEACTTGTYLRNEFSAMQSIVSTIVRDRTDCRVYLMANNVDFYCPTFDDFGISEGLKDIKKGDTKIFNYENGMKVSFTWLDVNCKLEKPKESDIFFGFNDSSSKMITAGEWQLPEVPHLPIEITIHPKDIIFVYFIEFKQSILQCEIIENDLNVFTFIHKKTTPIQDEEEDVVFTDDMNKTFRFNYIYGFEKTGNKIVNKIKALLSDFPLYFDSNDSGYIFESYREYTR